MKNLRSTGKLVTHGLVDSTVGAMAKKLVFVDRETVISKDMLLTLKDLASHLKSLDLLQTTEYTESLSVIG